MKKTFYSVSAVRKIPSNVLSAHEKLVLILLLEYRKCTRTYVSASKIAEEGSMSKTKAESSFRKLVALGIMHVKKERFNHSYRFYKEFDIDRITRLGGGQSSPPIRPSDHENKFSDKIDVSFTPNDL